LSAANKKPARSRNLKNRYLVLVIIKTVWHHFQNSCEYLEKDGVAIHEMFFKVVPDYEEPRAIGLVMMHEDSTLPFESFAVSVGFVEAITNLDFFHTLDDDVESEIESKCYSFFE